MKYRGLFFLLLVMIWGQNLHSQNLSLDLYPEGQIPNYRDVGEKEIRDTSDIVRIKKVQVPDITVYLPSKKNSTGDAVVICPGGGYSHLAYDWEGADIARYWNSKGVAAVVLKYRLPTSESQIEPYKSPLMDAQRAMRMVRYHASDWHINPQRIGIMGFSAGGHVASTLSTHYDQGNPDSEDPVERMSCKPDFSMLIYPVITFSDEFTHSGSKRNLLGKEPDPKLVEYFSNEKRVDENTPPAILVHSSDDHSVPVENSIAYYKALQSKGINASLHIYPYGGHGYSLAIGKGYLSGWPDRCNEWLKALD